MFTEKIIKNFGASTKHIFNTRRFPYFLTYPNTHLKYTMNYVFQIHLDRVMNAKSIKSHQGTKHAIRINRSRSLTQYWEMCPCVVS